MHTQNKGFSLIEVLVGMTIGLLGMLVITQVFSVTEASKQTTTSGGDAQQNAALSLHTIERDIRMAGYGMNSIPDLMGEEVMVSADPDANFLFTAAVIKQGADDSPDTITITYSNASMTNTPATITNSDPGKYTVNNQFGFAPGDMIIAAEEGKKFTLAKITKINGDQIEYESQSPNEVYTKNKAKLYNLGPMPISNLYSIKNSELIATSNFTDVPSETIANNVVDLQAEYGVDTGNDNVVDDYQTSVSGIEWSHVLSVRYGLVTRSIKREPSSSTTTTVPKWTGGDFNNVKNNEDWQHYRYRVFETTTLMRNMLWKP